MDAVIRGLHIKAIDDPEFAPQYQATIDRLQAADAKKAARAHIQAGFDNLATRHLHMQKAWRGNG